MQQHHPPAATSKHQQNTAKYQPGQFYARPTEVGDLDTILSAASKYSRLATYAY